MAALLRMKHGKWVHDFVPGGYDIAAGGLACGSTPSGPARGTSHRTTCPKCLAVRAERMKARERRRHRPKDYTRASSSFPATEVAVFNAVYVALRNGKDVSVLITRSDFQRLVVRFRAMATRTTSGAVKEIT